VEPKIKILTHTFSSRGSYYNGSSNDRFPSFIRLYVHLWIHSHGSEPWSYFFISTLGNFKNYNSVQKKTLFFL